MLYNLIYLSVTEKKERFPIYSLAIEIAFFKTFQVESDKNPIDKTKCYGVVIPSLGNNSSSISLLWKFIVASCLNIHEYEDGSQEIKYHQTRRMKGLSDLYIAISESSLLFGFVGKNYIAAWTFFEKHCVWAFQLLF